LSKILSLASDIQKYLGVSIKAGNTKGGSITVPLTSCFTALDLSVLQIKTKNVSCHIADSKPVKQEVKSTMILPLSVFPDKRFSENCQNQYRDKTRQKSIRTMS
jgi:hypothetical protein